ncbi:GNAT family protein [Pelagicoccus enzymogenes]|uniref:GNAT family N-acetyltransferase n=1 Tax=Pelagicoccus enzymogenes TaxID=2773457 RepID=UPI00281027A0|nr:GNAT family protein [Pelagicoccus enzymogenes]MDQ8201293.1 GNAT family protein [Pelagicoccus enzymogenes]
MKYEYTSESRIDSFWQALDQVARERKYLMFLKGPEIGSTRAFIREIIQNNWTQIFAIDGNEVVGWCDILPYSREGITHVGHLGMGVTLAHRNKKIGTELMDRALTDAFHKGLERIELDVMASNDRAIALYQKFGFQKEGRRRKARFVDGTYEDIITMGLLNEEADQVGGHNSGSCAASA